MITMLADKTSHEAHSLLPKGRNLLGSSISDTSISDLSKLIISSAHEERRLTVAAIALHGVTLGYRGPVFRSRLSSFDVLTPDGAPVALAAKWLYGGKGIRRVPGPDLTTSVLKHAASSGMPVFFFGSTTKTLDLMRKRLASELPDLRIAGARSSMFRRTNQAEKEELQNEIINSGARILFVGLGCPRQEVWMHENAYALQMPIITVGAAFDFIAGSIPRAPQWMRKFGLEWLFRIYNEPKRLPIRYLGTGPYFILGCLKQLMVGPPHQAPIKPEEIHFEHFG